MLVIAGPSCGGHRFTPGNEIAIVTGDNPWGLAGVTYPGDPTLIVIAPDSSRLADVIAHELLHAAGTWGHTDTTGCYTSPVGPVDSVCPEDRRALASVVGTYRIVFVERGLLEAAQQAVSLWNDEADRSVFVIE